MPVHKIDLQFKLGTEYWTNVFYTNASSVATAKVWVDDLVDAIQGAVQNSVTIDKARITPSPYIANTYTDYPIGVAGTGGSTSPAPLFNVVRWKFGKAVGRAVNHYFRGGVTPSNIGADGNFTSAAQTFNTSIADAVGALSPAPCDRNGNAYTTFSAAPAVGMRQLRRGSKRRITPVI